MVILEMYQTELTWNYNIRKIPNQPDKHEKKLKKDLQNLSLSLHWIIWLNLNEEMLNFFIFQHFLLNWPLCVGDGRAGVCWFPETLKNLFNEAFFWFFFRWIAISLNLFLSLSAKKSFGWKKQNKTNSWKSQKMFQLCSEPSFAAKSLFQVFS